jgi:GAF domain-containing protein
MDLGATRFAQLARELSSHEERSTTVAVISKLAVQTLECRCAGVAGSSRAGYSFDGGTDEVLLATIQQIANDTGQGPGLAALAGRVTVLMDDVLTEARWPDYRARLSAETTVRSALAFYLELAGEVVGLLALYDDRAGWFTDERIEAARAFADHAAVALAKVAAQDQAAQLEVALRTNRVIAEAVGILMATYRLDEESAFDLLRITSQHHNRKLRELADAVTLTGELPETPAGRTTFQRSTAESAPPPSATKR